MTPDQMAELAARLRVIAPLIPIEACLAHESALHQAADLIERMAQAEPVAWLRCNAMQWRKPGPVTAEHPLDCLIVVPALRQADGDWWIEGSKFLADDAPIAWCADTSIARAALAQYGIKEQTMTYKQDDLIASLRECEQDMADAIARMDCGEVDNGAMRIIRAERHDMYKSAADRIESQDAHIEALQAEVERLTQQRDENERDARRYQYILDCEVCAVKAFLPDIDPDAYREKVRAKHDAELAALAAQQGGDDE